MYTMRCGAYTQRFTGTDRKRIKKGELKMGVGQFSVAAATAVLGYDLSTSQLWKSSSDERFLTGFALKGSAAANDTKVSLYVDTVKVGEFYNTNTGFPDMDDVIPLDSIYVPAGANISIIVDDAASTNPINGILTWE